MSKDIAHFVGAVFGDPDDTQARSGARRNLGGWVSDSGEGR
jgi:hypothetical protein